MLQFRIWASFTLILFPKKCVAHLITFSVVLQWSYRKGGGKGKNRKENCLSYKTSHCLKFKVDISSSRLIKFVHLWLFTTTCKLQTLTLRTHYLPYHSTPPPLEHLPPLNTSPLNTSSPSNPHQHVNNGLTKVNCTQGFLNYKSSYSPQLLNCTM